MICIRADIDDDTNVALGFPIMGFNVGQDLVAHTWARYPGIRGVFISHSHVQFNQLKRSLQCRSLTLIWAWFWHYRSPGAHTDLGPHLLLIYVYACYTKQALYQSIWPYVAPFKTTRSQLDRAKLRRGSISSRRTQRFECRPLLCARDERSCWIVNY